MKLAHPLTNPPKVTTGTRPTTSAPEGSRLSTSVAAPPGGAAPVDSFERLAHPSLLGALQRNSTLAAAPGASSGEVAGTPTILRSQFEKIDNLMQQLGREVDAVRMESEAVGEGASKEEQEEILKKLLAAAAALDQARKAIGAAGSVR